MVEYSKVHAKLTNTKLKKLKNTVKNKTGTALRMSLKERLMKMISLKNCYWQQDKKEGQEMHSITICQLT